MCFLATASSVDLQISFAPSIPIPFAEAICCTTEYHSWISVCSPVSRSLPCSRSSAGTIAVDEVGASAVELDPGFASVLHTIDISASHSLPPYCRRSPPCTLSSTSDPHGSKRSELSVLEGRRGAGQPATGAYPDYSAAVGGAPRAGVPVPPMSAHETPPPPPGENTASHTVRELAHVLESRTQSYNVQACSRQLLCW
jgi:hypothetical protein